MKITKAIISVNDNNIYSGFWPIVAKGWKRLEIEPVLFYTGKNLDNINTKIAKVIHCPNIDVNSAFYAQNIRLLAPSLFQNDVCVISDIDLLPLSKDYFQGTIKEYTDDMYICYRPKSAVGPDELPIMFNAAKGSTWSEIFHVSNETDIYKKIADWYPNNYARLGVNRFSNALYRFFGWGDGWFTDQRVLRKHVDEWEQHDKKVFLNDEQTGFYQLDRKNRPNSTIVSSTFDKLIKDKYSCFHMPRPYDKHQNYIDSIFNSYD